MALSCRIDPVLGAHPNEYRPQPRLPARSGPTISFATALHTSRTSRHCTSFNTSSTTTNPLFLKIASAVASLLSVCGLGIVHDATPCPCPQRPLASFTLPCCFGSTKELRFCPCRFQLATQLLCHEVLILLIDALERPGLGV